MFMSYDLSSIDLMSMRTSSERVTDSLLACFVIPVNVCLSSRSVSMQSLFLNLILVFIWRNRQRNKWYYCVNWEKEGGRFLGRPPSFAIMSQPTTKRI